MKNLFNKPVSLLKYITTFSVAFVLLASIVTIFFGFNNGLEFGNAYEVRIRLMSGQEEYDSYLATTKSVLNNYGYTIRESKLESSNYDYSLLVRFKAEKTNKSNQIISDIATNLNIKESYITINQVKNTNVSNYWVEFLIVFLASILVIFAYGLIRKNITFAIIYSLQFLYNSMISLSILCASRIEVSLTNFNLIVIFAVISTIIMIYLISQVERLKEKSHNENKPIKDILFDVIKNNKFVALCFALVFVLVFGAFAITGDLTLIYASITGIISMFVCFFSVILFASPLYLSFIENSENKIKGIMSRNNLEDNKKKIETTNKKSK